MRAIHFPEKQCDSSHILTSHKRYQNMNQRTKNRDGGAAAVPPIKKRESETNPGIVIEKEQQGKVSVGDEEEEAAAEIGLGAKLQAATTKKQRGKYRQYEESQLIIEKIRSYRTQRYTDSEIMKLLENMPRRTYYNYVKKLQEQDRQIMEQWIAENIERFSEELMIYREALCQKLREVQGIIDNKNTLPRDKIQAIEQYLEISERLVKFEKSGRLGAMKFVKDNTSNPYNKI